MRHPFFGSRANYASPGPSDRAEIPGHGVRVECDCVGPDDNNDVMTDDSSGLHVRQTPRNRASDLQVADFTIMVRGPGRPPAVGVFTAAEHAEAAQYADEIGGEVVPLPLSPPVGYIRGGDGTLIPLTPPEEHGGADSGPVAGHVE